MDSLNVEKSKSGNSSTRDPKFCVGQDLLLCSAWSNGTNDAVVGIGQSGDHFWVKAHAYWVNHKEESFPLRSPTSLQQRFSRIKTAVSKFCGHLASVGNLSGYTEEDKIGMAHKMYSEFEAKTCAGKNKQPRNTVFAFEHCWRVLINDQKWLEVTSIRKSKDSEVSFNGSSPVLINVDGEEISPTATQKSVERPVGRKLAKEGRSQRKGRFVYDSSPILEKMDQTLAASEKNHNDSVAMAVENDKKMDKYLEMEKENLDLKKRKFSMDKQMFDMDIALKEAEFMKVDISLLTDPDQIEFYRSVRKNIKAKYQCNL